MANAFQDVGLEWEEWGYANSPGPKFALRRQDEPAWEVWVKVLQDAKGGNFRGVKRLIPIFNEAEHPVLVACCALLIGDAGTPDCYTTIADQLPAVEYSETSKQHVDILTARGLLADVPLMIQTFERFPDTEYADFIAYDLEQVLSPEFDFVADPESFDTPAKYAAAVRRRHREIVKKLGGEDRYAFHGALFSVVDLARGLLATLRDPDEFSPTPWRRKFEAATGIDCSSFYKKGLLQPLTAAALVEEFLDSPAAERFKPGARYFFGHRLPD